MPKYGAVHAVDSPDGSPCVGPAWASLPSQHHEPAEIQAARSRRGPAERATGIHPLQLVTINEPKTPPEP